MAPSLSDLRIAWRAGRFGVVVVRTRSAGEAPRLLQTGGLWASVPFVAVAVTTPPGGLASDACVRSLGCAWGRRLPAIAGAFGSGFLLVAGTLSGIMNTAGSLGGVVSPSWTRALDFAALVVISAGVLWLLIRSGSRESHAEGKGA